MTLLLTTVPGDSCRRDALITLVRLPDFASVPVPQSGIRLFSLYLHDSQQQTALGTYVPGGRPSVPPSASTLSREVAQCSASVVHALNGKPSAFLLSRTWISSYILIMTRRKINALVSSGCSNATYMNVAY